MTRTYVCIHDASLLLRYLAALQWACLGQLGQSLCLKQFCNIMCMMPELAIELCHGFCKSLRQQALIAFMG